MLTADEIHEIMRGIDVNIRIKILAELSQCRVFEAERILCEHWGPNRHAEAMELVASVTRGTIGAAS